MAAGVIEAEDSVPEEVVPDVGGAQEPELESHAN